MEQVAIVSLIYTILYHTIPKIQGRLPIKSKSNLVPIFYGENSEHKRMWGVTSLFTKGPIMEKECKKVKNKKQKIK